MSCSPVRFLPLILALLTLGDVAAAEPAMKERTGMRNARYGEILVVKGGPFTFTADVYNTIGLNDCPEAAWKKLDPARLKKEYKALKVLLNGPRYFVMDASSLANPGGVSTFDGLQARHLASVQLSLASLLRGRARPYTDNVVARTTRYVFKKGLPVYELLAPDGRVYVMQSYALIVDPDLTMAELPKLGSRLKLPAGWQFRSRVLEDDLILQQSGKAYVLQDDLLNSYQRR